MAEIVRQARPELEFDVASNPEFLREGNAIEDFMKPDRVVIGCETARAQRGAARASTGRCILIQTPILFTGIETAELTKYAANAFLAMKVTFINEMADLCERVGADVHDVARGIGLDARIGPQASCIRVPATAEAVSPRTRWRWCASRRTPARRAGWWRPRWR